MASVDKMTANAPVLRKSQADHDKLQPDSAGDIVHPASSTNGPGIKDFLEHRRMLSWCLLIYILPMNFGYEAASTGNLLAMPAFLARFGNPLPGGLIEITAHDQQVLNAAMICGVFIASACSGFVSDRLGRRWTILLGSSICIAGIFVQGFSQTILVLFGGKFISAIGFGMAHAIAPVFVAEIAPDVLRGICLVLVNAMVVVGSWTCSLVAYGTSHIQTDWSWRALLLSQLLFPVIVIVCTLLLLPESPAWLVIHGQTQKAIASLRRFNGPDFEAKKAVALIEATIEKEKNLQSDEATFMDCFKGPNRRRTVIVLMTFLAQQFSGSGFIAGYLPYFFTIAGVANPIGIAQISYSIQLLGNIASWFVVDRLGRRPLAVYGLFVMTATLLVIGGLGTIQNSPAALTAIVALMSIWGFLYQFTLGAVAYAVGGETPAARVRQKTYSINLMCTTASLCLINQITPLLINPTNANLGAKVAFVFFGLSVPLCIYLYFCFPEMKGRSYLELEEMFQNKVPARQFKKYKCTAEIYTTEKAENLIKVEHNEGDV